MNFTSLGGASEKNEKVTFLYGHNNCELLLVEKDGIVLRFNLLLFGNYIEGDGKKILFIGEKIEGNEMGRNQRTNLFRRLSEPSLGLIHGAIRLVENVEYLSGNQKQSLIKSFDDFLTETRVEA